MSDDRMLHEFRRDPDPRFAHELRERLRRTERAAAPGLRMGGLARVLVPVGAVVLVAALFTIPSVRVSAQAFLDIFRVKRFAAVEFNESRLETIHSLQKDRGLLIFDREEKTLDPGPARYVPSREAAAPQVGFPVSAPRYLPEGMAVDSVFVEGEGAMRFGVSESKLRTLLDRLELRDVTVPAGLDGRWIEVRKPPVVMQRFRSKNRRAVLIQAKSPEVSVPAGWDIERLAEIGLRVLGLDTGEARRIARSTDWRTTLLVPVPMDASTFRQVTVNGQPGLLITTSERAADGKRHREGTLLMWSAGDRVFCIRGNLQAQDVVQMAESVS